jgi:hypothetical protein
MGGFEDDLARPSIEPTSFRIAAIVEIDRADAAARQRETDAIPPCGRVMRGHGIGQPIISVRDVNLVAGDRYGWLGPCAVAQLPQPRNPTIEFG